MRVFIFAVLYLFFYASPSLGQKFAYLTLRHEPIDIPGRDFYIKDVADSRYTTGDIGWVQKESSNRKVKADFENSLKVTLEEYLADALPQSQNQTPVSMVVKVFRVFEEKRGRERYQFADVRVEFYYQSTRLLIAEEHIETSSGGDSPSHEANLREALENCLHTFAGSTWKEKVGEIKKPEIPAVAIDNKFENPDQVYVSKSTDPEKDAEAESPKKLSEEEIQELLPKNRNYWVIGLFVGGLGLGGVEYETRFHDHLGLNLGVSYSGYTAGIKFHFKPVMNGTFLNANFKDGGFGLMHIVGLDFGQRIGFSKKKRIGLVYQVGLGRVTRIDADFRNYLYGSGEMPPLMLTTGVGISF